MLLIKKPGGKQSALFCQADQGFFFVCKAFQIGPSFKSLVILKQSLQLTLKKRAILSQVFIVEGWTAALRKEWEFVITYLKLYLFMYEHRQQ